MMRAISFLSLAFLMLPSFAADSPLERGIAAFHAGHYADAKRELEAAVHTAPNDEHALTFLALTSAATGHCKEASPQLTERFNGGGDADLRRLAGLALAQCLVATDQAGNAVPIVRQLEAQYPSDADVLYVAARVYMRAFNDVTYRMFEKTPASYRVNQLSGEIFETQGKYAEAVDEYRKAIAKNPQAPNLHFRLGRAILLASHDPASLAQAQKEFEAELALNADDAAAEFQVGQILAAESKPAEALAKFDRALKLRPDFAEAALAAGKLHVQAKQYSEAVPLLERAIALQPSNEAAHYNLMLAYRNSGQMEKARREQQELQKLQQPAKGEFTDFLEKLGEKPAKQ